jgi:hypothetical protein
MQRKKPNLRFCRRCKKVIGEGWHCDQCKKIIALIDAKDESK